MSDSSSDEDILPTIISSSSKDKVHIKHPGVSSPIKSQYATLSKNPKWPDDLWDSGTLIYKIYHNDKPGKGNEKLLRFDSRFESGNLDQVYHLGGNAYHCILEYDKNKTGSCQWFYFKIMGVKADTKYHFYISGFHKNTGVFATGSKVFWYSEKVFMNKGISWNRGGSNYSYGNTQKRNRKRTTLQFYIKFPYDDDTVYLSYAIPYTYTDLLDNIKIWSDMAPPGSFSVKSICKSLGGRDCPMITITSENSSTPMSNKPGILLTSRIHPGESNGSVVLHGLIDFLVSRTFYADFLRNNYVIYIVPMINIDGVIEGFYRISLSGQDLNRVWDSPDSNINPEAFFTKEFFHRVSRERTIAAYLDFHGHSRLHGTFAYGCPNTANTDLINREKYFPRILSYLCDVFSWSGCIFSFPKERKAASRIVIRTELDVVNSFTIETSFGGINNGERTGILYDELTWKEIGLKCGESLYHLLYSSKSPVYNYVSQEMLFLSPPQIDDDIPEKERIDYIVSPIPNDSDFPQTFNHPTHLLKLKPPSNYLIANSRIISTKSPGYCAPKWVSLKFGEN